jgi:hypothetical protein
MSLTQSARRDIEAVHKLAKASELALGVGKMLPAHKTEVEEAEWIESSKKEIWQSIPRMG